MPRKLSRSDVMLVHERFHRDGWTHNELANAFDVSVRQVHNIVEGRHHKDVFQMVDPGRLPKECTCKDND